MKNILLGMVSCLFLATSVHCLYETSLDKAIKSNDLTAVKAALQTRRVSANDLLHKAVFHNNLEVVKVAIQAGADVNDESGYFPCLCSAIYSKNEKMVRFLLDQPGIKVDQPDVHGNTPLSTAITQLSNMTSDERNGEAGIKYKYMIGLLITKGANLDAHCKGTYVDKCTTSPRDRISQYLGIWNEKKRQEFLDECVSISNS